MQLQVKSQERCSSWKSQDLNYSERNSHLVLAPLVAPENTHLNIKIKRCILLKTNLSRKRKILCKHINEGDWVLTFSPFAPGSPTNPADPGEPCRPCNPCSSSTLSSLRCSGTSGFITKKLLKGVSVSYLGSRSTTVPFFSLHPISRLPLHENTGILSTKHIIASTACWTKSPADLP